MQTELIDNDALAEAKETMKAKFPTMVNYYLEDAASYMASIRKAFNEKCAERIISPAHTLKSSSKQMGALRMAVIAKDIEALAREQANAGQSDMAPFQALVETLEATFAETKAILPAKAA